MIDVSRKDCYYHYDMVGKIRQVLRGFSRRLKITAGWLIPGLGVKRWVIILLAGVTLLGLGLAFLVLDIYRTAPETWWLPILSTLSLRFLDRWLRVLIYGTLGVGLLTYGIWGLNRALLRPFVRPGKPVLNAVSAYRRRERGARVVAIGGGTGLSSLLRGLKQYTNNITAIVTVADDGGSSGELRRSKGILPPGDLRSCLTALSDDEALTSQLFQYRFASGVGLNGHSLGNLLITALTDITGSFEEAITESGRVLAIRGQVMPSTLHDVRLAADVRLDGVVQEVRVNGESEIPKVFGQIQRVWLEPNTPSAFPPAIQAILAADLIVIGPGSLYTSLLPNLLVPDLADAIRVSRAKKLFVCNVATQPGETDDYTTGDHLRAIEKHLGGRIFDVIVANNHYVGRLNGDSKFVRVEDNLDEEYTVCRANLSDSEFPWRHDSQKLAKAVMSFYEERASQQADA